MKKPVITDYDITNECSPDCEYCQEAKQKYAKDLDAWEAQQAHKPFWMVAGPMGSPRVRHDSYDVAYSEAKRLSAKNPGEDFYVLVTTDHMKATVSVETVEILP